MSAFPVSDAGAAKGPQNALAFCGPTVPIDNGIVGDFRIEVPVAAGGDAGSISVDPLGPDPLTEVSFELLHFVGPPGGASTQLSCTTITQPPTPANATQVVSEGNFLGPNGTIDWAAASGFVAGGNTYVNLLTFSSAVPFGAVRVTQYLDGDVPSFATDNLVQLGTFGLPDFRLLTTSTETSLALFQGRPATAAATCVGWAASTFSDLRDLIETGGGTFTPSGNVIGLPPTTDPRFSRVPAWGPDDITSAIACDLSPGATTAQILFVVTVLAAGVPIPTLSEWALIVMVALLVGGAAWRLRKRSVRLPA